MANVSKKEYDLVKEGEEEILKINANSWPYPPSIEGNALVMVKVIDYLAEFPSVSRIILNQRRNFIYTRDQTQMLIEVAIFYNHLAKQKKLLSISNFGDDVNKYSEARYLVFNLLRSDPIGAYVEVNRLIRENEIKSKRMTNQNSLQLNIDYLNFLRYFKENLEKTKLISVIKNQISGHRIGDRGIYGEVFTPVISPDFILTRLVSNVPLDAEVVDSYNVGDTNINIFKISGDIKFLYHITPLELKLSEEEYELVNLARVVLAEHRPKDEEFLEPSRMRRTFINIGKDLLLELSEQKGYDIPLDRIKKLAEILIRATIGFGMVEILLEDQKVQDITINSPVGENPIFLMHGEYGECVTNIIPSLDDSEGWATKFRLLSARPLDEANPILDTELEIPGSRARVAIIGNPLNPFGLAFALRRHRDKPWTLPLFINNKMINPLGAGLMSFLIDGARTLLVAGTRSSGKTSFLGALLVEIMRKYRVILLEDTLELPSKALRELGYNIQNMKVRSALTAGGTEVGADEGIRTSLRMGDSSLIVGEVRSSIRGEEEVIIVEDGVMKRVQIKNLEDEDLSDIFVPTIDFDLKAKLSKLTGFVKHPKRDKLLKIKTKTGREITVTHDHSLFAPTKNFEIAPVECNDLKIGDQLVIPSYMPSGFNDIEFINVFDYLPEFRVKNFENDVRNAIKTLGWRKATEICDINCGDIYNYFRTNQKTNIPFKSFNNLTMEADLGYDISNLKVKSGTSSPIPAVIPINNDFCRFLGYYVSEGYHSLKEKKGGGVIITNSDSKVIEDIAMLSQGLFDLSPKRRVVKGLGTSIQSRIDSLPLAKLIDKIGCGRTCEEKRIPSLIFGLSKHKIAAFLQALYEGDGSITVSKNSGNSIRYSTISKKLAEDLAYLLLTFRIVARVYSPKKRDGHSKLWVVEFKDRKMVKTFMKEIGFRYKNKGLYTQKWAHTKANFVKFDKAILKKHLIKYPRRYRHLFRFLRCSKNYLEEVALDQDCEISEKLKTFALGDFFLDEIKEIENIVLKEPEYVYDLSVKPSENFVGGFGGILLHNTEARALYEAMRIGALANVVAGTIHGDSPYGVYDRVVNDLQVPKTSFKATDIIIITNPVKTAGGLKSFRRVHSITEVRKHWQDDPLKEKGFVDLMKYNTENDTLETSDELINGDSEILKKIAGNIKEFAGDWDAVWENIQLRAKMKEAIVNYANKTMLYDLLEAKFVIETNDRFHRIADEIKEETGGLDNKRIFFEWDEWVKREIKKRGFL